MIKNIVFSCGTLAVGIFVFLRLH